MGYNFTPKKHAHHEINSAIADICLVRRSEEHLDIPDCNVIDENVTLPAKVMKQYKALERQLVIDIDDTVVDAQSAATLVNKLSSSPLAVSMMRTARLSTCTPPSTLP